MALQTMGKMTWKGVAVCAVALLTAIPAGADGGYARLFNEIGDTVEAHFYDANMVRERFDGLRGRYGKKASRAKTRTEFAALVNAMLGELKTSHTQYYTPDDPAYYQIVSIFRTQPNLSAIAGGGPVVYPSIGLETGRRGGKIFVLSVFEGGPADRAGLVKGDEIVSADGKPFEPVASLRGREGAAVRLAVRRRAGAELLAIEVVPVLVDPKEEALAAERASVRLFDAGAKKVGYIHISNYAHEDFHREFLDALAGPLKDADALVWDLRDGWGGANPEYLNVFNTAVPVLSFTGRDGTAGAYDPQWRKPAVMLINGRVRSGKEVLAYAFRKYRTGTVIGETTAGAVLGGMPFALSDGSVLYLAGQGVRVDGDIIEGKGVEPDIAVPMPLEYLEGRDAQLRRALEYLAETH